MQQRGGGSIVIIASIYGREAGGRMTYNAVKAAEISLAKSLAQQLAPSNIRVNSVSPGSILFEGGSWWKRQQENPAAIAEFVKRELPFGRFGRPRKSATWSRSSPSPRQLDQRHVGRRGRVPEPGVLGISYVDRLMIRQIAPRFFTRKWPRPLRYDKDKLGFDCVSTWDDPPVYAIVARDEHRIHFRLADPPKANPDKYADELLDAYLFIEDADALYAEYVARGVEFDASPWRHGSGTRANLS